MEKGNNLFEQAWQNAFQDAEANPSPLLWERIEGRMAMYENTRMRGRLLFYRVAATVLLLLLAGIGLYMRTNNAPSEYQAITAIQPESHQATTAIAQESGALPDEEPFAVTEEPAAAPLPSATLKSPNSEQREAGATLAGATLAGSDSPRPVGVRDAGVVPKGPALLATTMADASNQQGLAGTAAPGLLADTATVHTGSLLVSALSDADEVLGFSSRAPRVWLLPVMLPEPHLPVRVPVYELARPQQKQQWWETLPTEVHPRSGEPVWYAKVNVGSQFFDPRLSTSGAAAFDVSSSSFGNNVNSIASADTAFAFSAGQMGERHTVRPALSYGIAGGTYLNQHWLLEGGIQYAPGRTYSYTNWIHTDFQTWSATPLTWVAGGSQISRFDARQPGSSMNVAQVGYVERQMLITSFDFISVPLRAGYSMRWENIHFTLKAGMDSDWLLAGRVRPVNSRLESVTIQPGATAPYRSWLLSGALGNEVSYQLSDRHSLSLEAAYRFSLHSFTKEDALFNSQPMAYNVGMNFRYLFK